MSKDSLPQTPPTSPSEIDDFLRKVATTPTPNRDAGRRGRLMFAMDATASRRPTWDRACSIQGEMFSSTKGLGGLDIQLVFFRGFQECLASRWVSESTALLRAMTAVECRAGQTQICRILSHTLTETRKQRVDALVFVGDAMEESAEELFKLAGELGLMGVPAFLFHEGSDVTARGAFEEMARLTRGACCRFDGGSARQLQELLAAVAVYAAGGRAALADYSQRQGGAALLLTSQLDART